ncbi:uncharacterized protein LOC123694980 isoform X2 [Colias croceus]|uniref:uncharacterized protein LOC123694980 isoform X2 n=1 Tax=Colias crocea TaxID=72248 RepID=UPI001E27CD3E|nr:uncharacterized protein LOC123694980 isoform X2 [Colias croceus]
MGVLKSCVFTFIILVELQHIVAQPIFESLFCDFLCDDDSDYDFCDGCSSSEDSNKQTKTTSTSIAPNQEINIKIPASQGTVLDIINKNGAFSVMVDAQGSGSSAAPADSSTAAPTTAAGGSTTAAATTAKK